MNKNKQERRKQVPRSIRSDCAIIPRVVDYNLSFAVDPAYSFGWSPSYLWINGASSVAIPGASEISALFRYCRVAKVEITVLPGNNNFGYGVNTAITGARNIPYMYDTIDLLNTSPPSLSSIQQQSGVRVTSFDTMQKRTVATPQLTYGGGALLGSGIREKQYIATSADIAYNGWKVFLDLDTVALTYDVARISFKVFFECHTPV